LIITDKEGTETMDTQKLLGEVAGQLLSGAIKVVDLSAPLGPDTPLIKLPPELAVDTPKVDPLIPAMTRTARGGLNWLKLASIRGRISTRRSTGSPARTIRTVPPTPFRPRTSSVRSTSRLLGSRRRSRFR
jgi:hypothetical protein